MIARLAAAGAGELRGSLDCRYWSGPGCVVRSIKQPLPPQVPLPPPMTRWWDWLRANPAYVVATGVAILFASAPWPFALKVHAFLHGLCAQRFTHTFLLGGQALPFDARMTGIYGGFLVTFCCLMAMGRARAWRTPPPGVLALLAAFVVALAIDGSNSTLRDFGLWYAYEPDNRLRLLTGLLTGIALAALLCYLLATSLWRSGRWDTAIITSPAEVGLLVVLQIPFAAAVMSGFGMLYGPVSMSLVLAAVGVFVAMALSMLTLVRRRDQSYQSMTELQWPLATALMAALLVIGALAGGRYLLEWWIGIPPIL